MPARGFELAVELFFYRGFERLNARHSFLTKSLALRDSVETGGIRG